MKKKITIASKLLLLLIFVFGVYTNFVLAAKSDVSYADKKQHEAWQQQIEVSGTVTDAQTDDPLPGVNIVVQGTTTGTTTDMDGEYSIDTPADATLVFSFVGYQEVAMDIDGQQQINVEMEQAVTELEEVVAIGYGTREAGSVTGSVSSVNAEDIEDVVATDASETLKGSVSGITATSSHTPGGGTSIRVRGLGTINNNNPLWVVDGVPGAEVNPNNIESISVLKDASAQAIYGARAANGVILVSTKSGKKNQKTQVNIRIKNGITRNINSYNLLNTREYGEMLWLQARNEGREDYTHPLYGSGDEPSVPEYILPPRGTNVDHSQYDHQMIHEDGDDTFLITKANKEGTDWMDVIDRDAHYQEYIMDISGGGENTSYALMASYLEEEGMLKYTGYKRYNIRPNITFNPYDWLEIGEKGGVTFSQDWGNQSSNSLWSPISQTHRMQPIVPVKDVGGNYAGTRAPGLGNASNPMFLLDMNQHDRQKNLNASGNLYANATVFENLTIKTTLGYDYEMSDSRNFDYNEKAHAERGKYDELSEGSSYGMQWSWSNIAEYSTTFDEIHDLTVMVGSEAIYSESRWKNGSRMEFFSRNPEYMQLNVGVQNQQISGSMTDWSLFSVFSRLNYDLDDKYILTATFRRDGSSRFGEENRYGTFPAFSAGWRISEESFMEFSDNWLNYLKLRAGWGQSGNDQIGNYNGYTTFVSGLGWAGWHYGNSYYPITGINSGVPTSGFQSGAFGNPNVRWETTTTTNLGFDATVLDNLDITVDFWKRRTEDMLYPQKIPYVRGHASSPSVNVGTMNNTGVDVSLGYSGNALNEELQYNVALNVSHYQNEVEKLSGQEGEFLEGAAYAFDTGTRAEKGTAFPEFYGYIVEGIFQTEEEAASHPPAFGESGTYNEPGHFKYKDVNGDGVINADDRTYMGSPHPDFTGGLNFNLSYKGFRLSTRLYTSFGNELFNSTKRYLDFNAYQGNRGHERLYESWGSPYLDNNENATIPKAEINDQNSQKCSDYFLEDGSYLRMENLKLSYNLANLFEGKTLRNLTLYTQITNVFTMTNYTGLDPEVNASGMSSGLDQGIWPMSRQLLFGVNLGL